MSAVCMFMELIPLVYMINRKTQDSSDNLIINDLSMLPVDNSFYIQTTNLLAISSALKKVAADSSDENLLLLQKAKEPLYDLKNTCSLVNYLINTFDNNQNLYLGDISTYFYPQKKG